MTPVSMKVAGTRDRSRTEGNDVREGRTSTREKAERRHERMQNIERKEAQGNSDVTRESKRNIAATTPPKTLFL
jgi:hypothetical protein